jgi:hypothetical protein
MYYTLREVISSGWRADVRAVRRRILPYLLSLPINGVRLRQMLKLNRPRLPNRIGLVDMLYCCFW